MLNTLKDHCPLYSYITIKLGLEILREEELRSEVNIMLRCCVQGDFGGSTNWTNGCNRFGREKTIYQVELKCLNIDQEQTILSNLESFWGGFFQLFESYGR
jgi:hypothetical protein